MAIFLNIFFKTFAIVLSVILTILILISILSFIDSSNNNEYSLISGDENSSNTIVVLELNGMIINSNDQFSKLVNPFVISPLAVKNQLQDLENISPKILIFSINSPGGTVSASKNLYDIIKKFKKNNNVDIFFHTNELLASGGYWVSSSGDKIYANYGAVVGSIGVRGPDWFFYDNPKSISTGFLGNTVETKNGIKVYTSTAGKSKDIFNPFREPTLEETNQLQNMVDEIYDDFVRVVSKERKIEINTIKSSIGALIYTSNKSKKLHLIDDEISLDNLIQKTISENNYKSYKVLKNNNNNSLIKDIVMGQLYNKDINLKIECLSLRSSISAILSYQSTGC
mgnify:CR=1 FL=1